MFSVGGIFTCAYHCLISVAIDINNMIPLDMYEHRMLVLSTLEYSATCLHFFFIVNKGIR